MLNTPLNTSKLTLASLQTVKTFPVGYCGWKDKNSIYFGVTPNVPKLFNLKHPEDFIGISEYDLHENKEFVPELINHDLVTHQGNEWEGFELTNWKDFGEIIVFTTKIPLYDNDENVIGTFLQTQPLKDKKIFEMYAVLTNFQKKMAPSKKNKHASFEVHTRCIFSALTIREHECLFFTIRGKSAKQIAFILGLSVRTIEYYLDNIKNKMDCRTKPELVAKVLHQGYLNKIPKSLITTISSYGID